MFPKDQYRDIVTLFTPCRDEQGRLKYARQQLKRCFWDGKASIERRNGGIANAERPKLHIPLAYNPGYTRRTKDPAMADKQPAALSWNIRIGGDFERSMMFLEDVEYPALEVRQSRDEMEETLQRFRREILSGFFSEAAGDSGRILREYGVSDVDERMFGPESMYRVVVDLY